LTIEKAQLGIIQTFDLLMFYREFGHKITNEIALEWLKSHTPDTFLPKLKTLGAYAKEVEEAASSEMKQRLKKYLSSNRAEKLALDLRGKTAPGLQAVSLKSAEKEELIHCACLQDKRLSFLKDADFMKNLTDNSYEEIKEKIQEAVAKQRRTYPKDQEWLKKVQELSKALAVLLEEIDAIDGFLALMDRYQIAASVRLAILQIKQVDESSLEMLGEVVQQEGVDFSPKIHILPSSACVDARRLAYSTTLLEKRGKMLLEMLKEEGVLEQKVSI
jgi:hypothetical protein